MVVSGQVTREYEVKKENDVKCEWNIIKSREMIFVYLKSGQLSLLFSLYSYSLSLSFSHFIFFVANKKGGLSQKLSTFGCPNNTTLKSMSLT
jgi:hypothetical protein